MIFKIHYGLWYGGLVGIIPFMFAYAKEYSGATATQHGILYTILPFIALLAKPVVCSVADKYAAHHHCLLLFISLTILGYGSLAIYPFFGDWTKQHQNLIWIFYCFAAFLGNTSMCVVNSIGDSLAINSCQRKELSYGQYRLWGPVGFGIFGAIWGIANDTPYLPQYTPGILTMVTILIFNSLLIAFWYDRDEFKILSTSLHEPAPSPVIPSPNYGSTNQTGLAVSGNENLDLKTSDQAEEPTVTDKEIRRLSLLCQLVRENKSIIVYVFIFTFCGIMTGIHWQFFIVFLQRVAEDRGQSFKLITTLVLPVQALGGELVFFMLAGKILKRLGASLTLVLCLTSFAARYLLYAYLIPHVSMYWILLVELLQGPAFGLMYCVLTHQANIYSEKIDEIVCQCPSSNNAKLKRSLHATLQGILGASFEGLGLGLGAIIGGRTYDIAPILMWQIAGFSALAVALLHLLGTLMLSAIKATNRRTVDVNL